MEFLIELADHISVSVILSFIATFILFRKQISNLYKKAQNSNDDIKSEQCSYSPMQTRFVNDEFSRQPNKNDRNRKSYGNCNEPNPYKILESHTNLIPETKREYRNGNSQSKFNKVTKIFPRHIKRIISKHQPNANKTIGKTYYILANSMDHN